ncbi:Crp/Fnr family transcriptional regulator [Thermodesulfobacteriota bacterium]
MAINPIVAEYLTEEEKYAKGSFVFRKGNFGSWVYVVLKGEARVVKKTFKGNLTLMKLKGGDIFGETSFLQPGEVCRNASVVADSKLTIGLLNQCRLTENFESLSPQLRRLISTLVTRLQDATDQACVMQDS